MSIYHDIFTTSAAYARMAEIFMDFNKVIGYTNLAHSDVKRGKVLIRHGILHLWLRAGMSEIFLDFDKFVGYKNFA